MPTIKIGNRLVGDNYPTYFIADISANHDGSLIRAKELCKLAKEAGADSAKFQHFRAQTLVSHYGFEQLGKIGHQAGWSGSIYEAYKKAEVPWSWTRELKEYCDSIGIEFMSTPYDLAAVDHLNPYVNAFKVGSGDITYTAILEKVANTGKPVILSSGASDMIDIEVAMATVSLINTNVALLQCNTNYTGITDNINYVNLNVLKRFREIFPMAVLGLSDHNLDNTIVLGAVALGARIIERHFTDDCMRKGPDHSFSMNPNDWTDMVQETRELERALGSPNKFLQANEEEAVIVQRRCLRAVRALRAGDVLLPDDIVALRPAPGDSLAPWDIDKLIGATVKEAMNEGDYFRDGSIY